MRVFLLKAISPELLVVVTCLGLVQAAGFLSLLSFPCHRPSLCPAFYDYLDWELSLEMRKLGDINSCGTRLSSPKDF